MGWLFEAKKRYGLSVVNDTVTSNQLQQAGNRISLVSIHHQKVNVIAGGTGQQYNPRKLRPVPLLWRGEREDESKPGIRRSTSQLQHSSFFWLFSQAVEAA